MKWWSESRKGFQAVEDMNAFHARAALAKLDRGDYFNENGEQPSVDEANALRDALQRAIGNHQE